MIQAPFPSQNIPAGGQPSRLRALRAQRREKRHARNVLTLETALTPWHRP